MEQEKLERVMPQKAQANLAIECQAKRQNKPRHVMVPCRFRPRASGVLLGRQQGGSRPFWSKGGSKV